jgi:hypothetical protein
VQVAFVPGYKPGESRAGLQTPDGRPFRSLCLSRQALQPLPTSVNPGLNLGDGVLASRPEKMPVAGLLLQIVLDRLLLARLAADLMPNGNAFSETVLLQPCPHPLLPLL